MFTPENPAGITNKVSRFLLGFLTITGLVAQSTAANAMTEQPQVPKSGDPTCDTHLPPSDQPYSVGANCTVMGDVQFGLDPDGLISIYNSNEGTGFSVRLKRPSQVLAPFGADASTRPVNDLIRQQLADGCGQPGGCDSALNVAWGRYDDAHPAPEGTAGAQPQCNFNIPEGQGGSVAIPAGC